MDKRGFEHIEMIIAFIMFIGFLIFGLYFFNPLDTTRVLDSSADYAMTAIEKNVTSELKIYTVVLDIPQGNAVPLTVSLPLDDFNGADNKYLVGKGVRTEAPDGAKLKANLKLGDNVGDFVYIQYKQNKIFNLKIGLFHPQYDSVADSAKLSYNISSSDVKNIAGLESVKSLIVAYNKDYEKLKKDFNLPGRVDFDFFLDLPGTANDVNVTKQVPEGLDVKAKSERLEVFLDDGSIVFGDLTVRAW